MQGGDQDSRKENLRHWAIKLLDILLIILLVVGVIWVRDAIELLAVILLVFVLSLPVAAMLQS